jgi:tetratricopeptide (TPR) repeat protein
MLRQALGRLDEALSGGQLRIKESCQRCLAVLLIDCDEACSEAEQIIRRLLYQQWQRNASADDIAHTIVGLARALEKQEQHREAEILHKQMLERPEELGSLSRNALTLDLSRALLHQGKLAEAKEVAQREHEHALNYGATDSRLQTALMTLGEVKLAQKAYAEAAALLGQACDAAGNPDHPRHLECRFLLARALAHLCLYDRALATYTRAIDGYGRVLGHEDPFTRTYTRELDSFRAFLADREASKADTKHMRQDPEDWATRFRFSNRNHIIT